MIKCMETELLHFIRETWGSRSGWKCVVGSCRGSDEELCLTWELLLPLKKKKKTFCCKPKSSIWLLSAALGWIQLYIFQISTSTLDLWHQPGSLNQWIWKPQRAWTLVSEGKVTTRSALRPQPIYLPECPAFVSSTPTWGGKVCWSLEEGKRVMLSSCLLSHI